MADLQATMEELTMKLLQQNEKFEKQFVHQKKECDEKLAQQEEKLVNQEAKIIHLEAEIASLKAVVMKKPDDVTGVTDGAVVAENGKLKI